MNRKLLIRTVLASAFTTLLLTCPVAHAQWLVQDDNLYDLSKEKFDDIIKKIKSAFANYYSISINYQF